MHIRAAHALPDSSVLDDNIPPVPATAKCYGFGARQARPWRWSAGRCPDRGRGPSAPLLHAQGRTTSMSTLPVSLSEAILGAKEKVPTPSGAVTMTVPKWANTGSVLRLKGKGVPRVDGSRGDELVTLRVVLPEKPDPELEKFVAHWRGAYSPRQGMET